MTAFRRWRISLVVVFVLGLVVQAQAEDQFMRQRTTGRYRVFSFSWRLPRQRTNPNVRGKTLGGKQFWSDQIVVADWRLQRNAVTDHYRVLDDKNVRRAWGTKSYCEQQFAKLRKQMSLKPATGKVVVVLHGLTRTRSTMDAVCKALEKAGYTTVNVTYASTRLPINEHAKALARIVSHLDQASEINFVAHSMGNLVVRHYLGDLQRQQAMDPRMKRFVMLGPPNHGAVLARRFKDSGLVKVVWGDSGDQLAEWKKLEKRLATPPFQFGIIAGGRGKNPLIPGDDDLFVSVKETRLIGARDFYVANGFHSQLPRTVGVHERIVSFVQNGYFVSETQRQPIVSATSE